MNRREKDVRDNYFQESFPLFKRRGPEAWQYLRPDAKFYIDLGNL